jgi:hypothetical protein
MPNKTYIAQANQNIFDVLLQNTGSIEGLFDLIDANSDTLTEVSSNIDINDAINIPHNIVRNYAILKEYEKRKITVASGSEHQTGIGFMSIEQTFIIT